ncbi:hypothetical protein ACFQY7_20740 [Actinomadura luteofluorescens]|uniref:hypothetical protein n=1 Tax=Actinomadura luteofluorescens TaxID=46163 RepID=UPI003645A0C6
MTRANSGPRAEAEPSADAGPPATRRRGGDLEAAIFDAVFAQLEAVGYRGLTMEGVAAAPAPARPPSTGAGGPRTS